MRKRGSAWQSEGASRRPNESIVASRNRFLRARRINVVFCPEGDRWSYYRDATKPDSTPVPYRGADKRRLIGPRYETR